MACLQAYKDSHAQDLTRLWSILNQKLFLSYYTRHLQLQLVSSNWSPTMAPSVSAELITAITLGILQILISMVSIWQQRHLGHLGNKGVPVGSIT